jgi:hypothetical protein
MAIAASFQSHRALLDQELEETFPSQSARAIRWEVRPRLEMMAGQCHSRPALLLRALEAMHPSWLAPTGSSVSLNRGSGANGLGGSTARLAADSVVTSTSAVMPSLTQLKHSTQVQLHHGFARNEFSVQLGRPVAKLFVNQRPRAAQ